MKISTGLVFSHFHLKDTLYNFSLAYPNYIQIASITSPVLRDITTKVRVS